MKIFGQQTCTVTKIFPQGVLVFFAAFLLSINPDGSNIFVKHTPRAQPLPFQIGNTVKGGVFEGCIGITFPKLQVEPRFTDLQGGSGTLRKSSSFNLQVTRDRFF